MRSTGSGNQLPCSTGWQGSERIYGPVVQLRSNDDQVVGEANWIADDGVANDAFLR